MRVVLVLILMKINQNPPTKKKKLKKITLGNSFIFLFKFLFNTCCKNYSNFKQEIKVLKFYFLFYVLYLILLLMPDQHKLHLKLETELINRSQLSVEELVQKLSSSKCVSNYKCNAYPKPTIYTLR